MAMVAESAESDPAPDDYPKTNNPQAFDETTAFIDYAVAQAQLYHKAFNDAFDSTVDTAKSRFFQIRSTSSAHIHNTLDSLDDLKSQYNAYEDLLFGKIKEGVLVAASHPVITCGASAALGLLVLKRPRRVLYYNTLRLFASEERKGVPIAETKNLSIALSHQASLETINISIGANLHRINPATTNSFVKRDKLPSSLISRAHAEVKELRQSIELLKAEGEKLEKLAAWQSSLGSLDT
ncbi:hypothetical protein CR513_27967, partial [Mucuna pruriens]